MRYKAKKIGYSLWEYRGYKIERIDNYEPEGRTVWEVEDTDGTAFGQSFSFKDCKMAIDNELKESEVKDDYKVCIKNHNNLEQKV